MTAIRFKLDRKQLPGISLFLGLAVVALAGAFAATVAQAAVTISSAATANMNCSQGLCTPTANDAVLNVGDLENLLAAGNVTVTTTGAGGVQANDIIVHAPLTWSSGSTLSLDAYQSIAVRKPVSLTGTGGVSLTTNDGGSGGMLSFAAKADVSFANLSSAVTINGQPYTLVGDIQTLAQAIKSNPSGNYALAADYDASADGVYSSAPIPDTLTGNVQ